MVVNVHRDQWRYVLFVDQNALTGPFMIDLITPHIGINKYDRIDFDVNNLSPPRPTRDHERRRSPRPPPTIQQSSHSR
ncbi:unnamed protein product [Rotaria sp. Silwood2]|nr:unnamed protein product [Rotaria sp. Silwood2]CAF2514920.1 unnamed protein product [Rotaria sp. Silwood2]CAF4482250.1 unnamed protein product [Rotaria sp. Silwood2]CAF4514307.1 unnamed protein product [Rotaria sp. Silwood2]